MIGVFVVGSFALLLAAIIAVGAGNFFSKPRRFVCMFQGNLNGLKIGAPVKFKGVQIGVVENIDLILPPGEGEISPQVKELRLPVVIGIDHKLLQKHGGTGQALTREGFEGMLARGLRAQLGTESLLTGLLFVDLDLHPNTPLNLALVPGSGNLEEIPTIPTDFEEIQKHVTDALVKIDKIDFNGLVASITKAADSINTLADSPDLKSILASMKQTVPNLNQTVISARAALIEVREKIGPLVTSIQHSSVEANSTMKETRDTLVALEAVLEPDSPLSVHLNEALDELASTTRSVGELTDYLQRNPSSVIRGRYVPEKDRTTK
jgi:paraquat-inducible protein B